MDFEDLEALRQAALASVKSRGKTDALQQESSPSSTKADEDEDLSALREAALRSTKIQSDLVPNNKIVTNHEPHPITQHRRHLRHHRQRRLQHRLRQHHTYNTTERNGSRWKCDYSQKQGNNLVVIPLALQGGNKKKNKFELYKLKQKSDSNLELSSKQNALLPQDEWVEVESNVSENISAVAAPERNLKKRKDGKFSRYDDSESDDDSMSDSDILSLSSESQLNKGTNSDSEQSISHQPDTRIVKQYESKDIVIQKAVTDNTELEATGDSLEIHDKMSSDSLLEDLDEPLLDIQENGEIDDTITTTGLDTSDKQETDEAFCVDLLPSESLELEEEVAEESEPVSKEVFEARKKKFESTEEIKGPDLKKTISLKGIVPKSRKRHRQHHRRHHRENKLPHSNHKEELHSRDLKERNCEEVEDLRLKTSRAKDYRLRSKAYSSGSSKSSDDSCHSGNYPDSISQPLRLKNHPYYHLDTGINTSDRFNQPIPSHRENQRRVVQERSPRQTSDKPSQYHFSDLSDSGEDNENSLLKKPTLSSVVRTSPKFKRHNLRKVLDSDCPSNVQKDHCLSDSKEKETPQPRGWAALIESRSKRHIESKKNSDYHHRDCDSLDLEEPVDKSPRINFTFEQDEVYPAKKIEDRLSAPRWLGSTTKSTETLSKNRGEKTKDVSKETELDQKILRIQEMNAAILKRQAEVKKDKERYG